jgi:hypothetical protein
MISDTAVRFWVGDCCRTKLQYCCEASIEVCGYLFCQPQSGFPIVRPVRAKVSPGPDDNFRGKQTKDGLGLGQQSHGRKDCRALQSSSAHCARRYYNTNMITYKQTRPSAHYQASSIHNCSSSASVCMWTLASSGTQPQHSDASRI